MCWGGSNTKHIAYSFLSTGNIWFMVEIMTCPLGKSVERNAILSESSYFRVTLGHDIQVIQQSKKIKNDDGCSICSNTTHRLSYRSMFLLLSTFHSIQDLGLFKKGVQSSKQEHYLFLSLHSEQNTKLCSSVLHQDIKSPGR